MTKKYLVLDEASDSERWMEIRTRLVAGTYIASVVVLSDGGALSAADGHAREFTGPTPDDAILEADSWLRDEYEIKAQDTLEARE